MIIRSEDLQLNWFGIFSIQYRWKIKVALG